MFVDYIIGGRASKNLINTLIPVSSPSSPHYINGLILVPYSPNSQFSAASSACWSVLKNHLGNTILFQSVNMIQLLLSAFPQFTDGLLFDTSIINMILSGASLCPSLKPHFVWLVTTFISSFFNPSSLPYNATTVITLQNCSWVYLVQCVKHLRTVPHILAKFSNII